MAKTSISVQPIKGGSEMHNKREKDLSYVRPELSHKNESWEADSVSKRTAAVKETYKKNVGQQMQKKATPIREGVVVIGKGTSMGQLQELARKYEERFGIKTFQIHVHRDEGHMKAKDWKPNLHAHMIFDWTDEKGKSLKLNRQDMAEMQTITAEVLGMERGKSSDKKHETAQQYKLSAQKQELEKFIGQLQSDLKKYELGKITKSTLFKAIERTKDLMGISTNDKEKIDLRAKNEALVAKMEETKEQADKRVRIAESQRQDIAGNVSSLKFQLSNERQRTSAFSDELKKLQDETKKFSESVKDLLFDGQPKEVVEKRQKILKDHFPTFARAMGINQEQTRSRGKRF